MADAPTNLFYWHDGVIKQVPLLAAQAALPGPREFKQRRPPAPEDPTDDRTNRA